MILLETRPTAAESWVLACDVCGDALDPGEVDALEVGRDLCPAHVLTGGVA